MRTVDPSKWTKKNKARLNSSYGKVLSEGVEKTLRRSFSDAFQEFVTHSHLSGLKLCFDEEYRLIERRFYTYTLLLILSVGSFMIWYGTWSSVPLVETALPSLEHSIAGLPFPAVALCSYNIVSLNGTKSYARFLNDKRKALNIYRNYTESYIFANLLKYASLINLDLPNLDTDFPNFLSQVDEENGNNVSKVILQVTRSCEEQLQSCSWHGERMPCKDLFAMRVTGIGFCCVFNGRYTPADIDTPPKILTSIGQHYGLNVVLKKNTADHAFMRKNSLGTEVLIFDGTDFPLLEGGGTRSYPALINASTYITLVAAELQAREELTHLSEDQRGCRFKDLTGNRSSATSYAWCLTMCRVSSVRQLCGCVPPNLPAYDDDVCSLEHLPCLNKHREKLLFYFPTGTSEHVPELQEETSDSIDCYMCKPDCTRTRYSGFVDIGLYSDWNKTFRSYFSFKGSVVNTSYIRIFYATEAQRLYTLKLAHQRHERFCSIGGIVHIILGSTQILIAEIFYFFVVRWAKHFFSLKREEKRGGMRMSGL